MNIEPTKKTPAELLAYQTELLEEIADTLQDIKAKQLDHGEIEIEWLQAISQQAAKQVDYLKNINTVSTIFGILLILGICSWVWVFMIN